MSQGLGIGIYKVTENLQTPCYQLRGSVAGTDQRESRWKMDMGHNEDEFSSCFPRLASREAAGPLVLGCDTYTLGGASIYRRASCVLDTYPVMDVSTSCTSGTVRVRVLSRRASECSMLPLCGERRVKGQWSMPAT